MVRNFVKQFGIYFFGSLVLINCISDTKKNLESLKACKFDLVDVRVELKPNPSFPLIPLLDLYPQVSVTNPNPTKVSIYEFDLDIELVTNQGKEYIGKLQNQTPVEVEPNSETLVVLKLVPEQNGSLLPKLLLLAKQLGEAAKKGEEAEFEIYGTVQIDSVFGKLPVPVREVSRIKLKR
ncbi:LEA type 2 family protein [Leptospira paudalimensis]|uniref:LEA type 2 family protein n=1 Tax=Leptospira paudalimensis TaxID=2950024 RepID=A0ABT3MAX4_9LEPT|nr:LEA type 2 family protein [Leptospira paudalimensis]MCW7505528.1 LEA type 2 family protein [Leptospira paudalimensis]